MGLFDETLHGDETLFRNPVALDFDFMPKLVPYRENEQFHMAGCIRPLFSQRSGRNLLIHGPPGVGKTVACRHVLRELEEKAEDIYAVYLNCWQRNTTHKVALGLCEQLGYMLTHNKNTDELLDIAVDILNKGAAVLVFDEVDKLEDTGIFYTLLEKLYRKCLVLITNLPEWGSTLDARLASRLALDTLRFKPYSPEETRGILRQRAELGFVPDALAREAFDIVVAETARRGDLRVGLHLLREAGNAAEEKASRRIIADHVKLALARLQEFTPKKGEELDEAETTILEMVRSHQDTRIGDLFRLYQEKGGTLGYKSFQRKMRKLEQGGYITVRRTQGGPEGNTSIISGAAAGKADASGATRTLDEYR